MKRFLSFVFITGAVLCCLVLSASAATAGKVETNGGRLNIRSAPAGTVIGSINNGSYLTLKDKKDGWYLAEYTKGKEAWVSESYIKNYTTSKEYAVRLSGGSLNVRSGASTSHSITGGLYNGERVIVLKSSNGWSEIIYHGNKKGYVSSAYLKALSSENDKYAQITLTVPSYKQTDSRWSSYPLGTNGGTIGKIGCTTTALAMTESFHKGYSITPPEMAKKLTYSASGSLYWPSDYKVINSPENYLQELYNALSSGKPVVFGMKTLKGNQHWVTVYGYEGGSTLTAGGFLVNDPGSSIRKTLATVLEAYPVAYRLVYKK